MEGERERGILEEREGEIERCYILLLVPGQRIDHY